LLPPRRRIEEVREPAVSLRPMTSSGEVVEDYRHVGLTLRQHPASFLRAALISRRIVTCLDAMNARDGKWLTTAGLVLVRQNGEGQIAYDQSGFVYSLDVPLASIAAAL
jgi:error-prone DNA polymerase